MLIKKLFTVPSYYKSFACKAASCRHTCCEGLSIHITQEEYLRLVGLDCSPALRQQLDLALHVLSHPDEYKYACISPTYTGQCRMLDENGLCALQKECGYDILTAVCKYFPRHPVLSDTPVCSMANACEETLELFLDEKTDWSFDELPLEFALPSAPPSATDDYRKLRQELTLIMADASTSLSERLRRIHDAAKQSLAEDSASSPPLVRTKSLIKILQIAGKEYDDLTLPAHRATDYLSGLVNRGLDFDEDAFEAALNSLQSHFMQIHLNSADSPFSFSAFLSKVLANGMFYHGFPFGEEAAPASPAPLRGSSFSSLQKKLSAHMTVLHYAVYLLTALLYANEASLTATAALIDLTAAFSRMADLSDFDKRVLSAHAAHDSDFPDGISA